VWGEIEALGDGLEAVVVYQVGMIIVLRVS
jgi:hypothetical protein